MDAKLAARKKQLEAELAEIRQKERVAHWGSAVMEGLSDLQKFELLDLLVEWAKNYKGHRPDCDCGECD